MHLGARRPGERCDCIQGLSAAVGSLLSVPTVLRVGPYRVYFFSHEPNEPPHVHVDREAATAKFWLGPVELASNLGFRPAELRKIRRILMEHEAALVEAWHEHFGP